MKVEDLWLVIPTGERDKYLAQIFRNSLIPMNQIVLIRTKPGKQIDGVQNIFVKSDEINIQKWWNTGIAFAEEHGAKFVAVLNDDVAISPGSLQAIAFDVEEKDVPLGFPFPHSGQLAGYCWVLNLKFPVRPDERFKWWYGDNDLQMQAQLISKYIYVSSSVEHLEANKLTSSDTLLSSLGEQDHLEFVKKWSKTHGKKELSLRLIPQKIKRLVDKAKYRIKNLKIWRQN